MGVQSQASSLYPPGIDTVHIIQETGLAQEPVRTGAENSAPRWVTILVLVFMGREEIWYFEGRRKGKRPLGRSKRR